MANEHWDILDGTSQCWTSWASRIKEGAATVVEQGVVSAEDAVVDRGDAAVVDTRALWIRMVADVLDRSNGSRGRRGIRCPTIKNARMKKSLL